MLAILMAMIEAEKLVKTFPGEIEAVKSIDISVEAGGIFGFLGPNGAGKSTTTKILTTLIKPTSGRATVAGYDVVEEAEKVRESIGVALQEAGLDDLQSGRELLTLQGRLYGLKAAEASSRAEDLLGLVGLTEAADRLTRTYSGGMKRRLDLAAALVHRPNILFLDEPTTGLDPASRLAIWDYISQINREDGTTVFLTTQYLEEADRLCNVIAIIDHGVIVSEGTPEELKASIGTDVVNVTLGGGIASDDTYPHAKAVATVRDFPGLDKVRETRDGLTLFVASGARAIPELIRKFDEAGLEVKSISVSGPSLDDVFLEKTGYRLEGDDHSGNGDREE